MAISDFLDFRTNIFISIVFKNIVKAIGCERFNRYKILKIRNILSILRNGRRSNQFSSRSIYQRIELVVNMCVKRSNLKKKN